MTNGEKLKAVLNPRANQIRILGDWVEIEIQKLGINFSCGLDWWNTEYKEPTTKNDLALIHTWGLDEGIRCAMCTNSIKSDRGCDGGCVVNNAMYKEVMDVIENHIVDTDKMVEPTTKNDCENCIHNKGVLECDMYGCKYEPTTKNDLGVSSGLENASPFIDWNNCHTSEQLDSLATAKNDLGVDCISRADVLNHLANIAKVKAKSDAQKSLMGRCMFMVENIPSITPQEPKTGHWKYFQNEKGDWMNVCSNCNSDCGVGYPYNYCPNCGCRMER